MHRVGILSVLLLASSMPARAYVPEQTPPRSAEAAGRRVLAQRPVRATVPAIVVARGGRTLFSINGTRPMQPASLMKLLTTTAAIVRFGPHHRFVTRVVAARTGGSTAVGNLYLVGGGDPTLATTAYRREHFFPKPADVFQVPAFPSGSPTVEGLARAVARVGIRLVRGSLVVDESMFDGRRTAPGWLSHYLGYDPDSGLLTALVVNEGRLDIKGKILAPQPALLAGAELKRALAGAGVRVIGSVIAGVAPGNAVEIARAQSPPLDELVGFTNRYSKNMFAEMMLKSLGARFGGEGSTAAGVRVTRTVLRSLHVPATALEMADGSGLSVRDRIAPRTLAVLLGKILAGRGRGWGALRASLPVAGGPGTLQRRKRAPLAGNLHAKTGSVRSARGMAGWVTASDGMPIVFVVIFNASFARDLTPPLDLFGLLLARYPD